jgi:hypothetical protein
VVVETANMIDDGVTTMAGRSLSRYYGAVFSARFLYKLLNILTKKFKSNL